MKIVKMSLVAALLVGSSAFAIENIKVSGDAQLMYDTTDAKGTTSQALVGNTTKSGDLFDKDSSAADAGLHLNLTADLVKNDYVSISAGAGYTVLSTLGLENNLVSNVFGSSHTAVASADADYAGGAKVENANWFNEAWIAATAGKTTVKIGRMELDTPLAFTEKWSIERNTFEAAVVINQDIKDTTLVGAYVGNGNGSETFGEDLNSNVAGLGLAVGGVVNGNGDFATYGTNGAYAVGAINNSFKPLTVQAWYYDVTRVAQAYWLQADLDVDGILAGAQYSYVDVSDFVNYTTSATNASVDSDVYAFMLGYTMKDVVTAKIAYSQVGKDFAAGFNTATSTGTAQSKLYTEAWWSYGQVTQADTSAVNLTLTSPVQGIVDLGLYVTLVDHEPAKSDLTEVAVTAGKKFGPLDATLAYINTDVDGGDTANRVQAYLTLNF
jgi:hypothetical protein